MLKFSRRHRPQVWKGLVAGTAGGLVGTIVMTQLQKGWQKASKALTSPENGAGKGEAEPRSESEQQSEDATMKAAEKAAQAGGYSLSQEQKKKASSVVHYGFGTAMGALYGVLREVSPKRIRKMHPALAGLAYGSALFVGADEIAVPMLGLSTSPKETPASAHLYAYVSHAIYGVTGEMVMRTVRDHL